MIDLHCHLLPGIDDGPVTLEGSLGLARAAYEAGVQGIVATPHVNARYPNRADTIEERLARVSASVESARLPLAVHFGAEIAIGALPEIPDAELGSLTLGHSGSWLLIEPPFAPVAPGIDGILYGLQHKGYKVLLAHPERCPAFHRDPVALERLARAGVALSITAGSLVGHFGRRVEAFSRHLAEAELIHNVASDAHDLQRRPPGMARELARAGLEPLADWLTHSVPSAILSGDSLPPRPASAPRPRRQGWTSIRRLARRA